MCTLYNNIILQNLLLYEHTMYLNITIRNSVHQGEN